MILTQVEPRFLTRAFWVVLTETGIDLEIKHRQLIIWILIDLIYDKCLSNINKINKV